MGLDDAPPSFDVVRRLEEHLQYISDMSKTHLSVRGRGSGFMEDDTGKESTEPLHICIQ